MSEETVVTPVTETVAPAAPAEEVKAPAEEVKAEAPSEEKVEKEEEQHRSRAWRRLDRWRQRAIEAETRLKLSQEAQPKPVEEVRDSNEPTRDKFETYEDFIEARAEWRATQATNKTLQEAIKREEQERIRETQKKSSREWSQKVDKARNEIEDFDEVCSESEAPVTGHMSSAIMESDRGPQIAYYLAQHPEEAERISKLTPSKQVAAIVNLEEKVAKPVKTPSKAPAPITPVTKSSSPDNDAPSDKDDTATWIRKEKARMEKLGIR